MPPESPDSAEDSTPIAFLYQAFDDMIAVLGQSQDELAAARTRYEERRGRVFEDEELWESWSQAFLEWYALESVLHGNSPGTGYLSELTARAATGSLGATQMPDAATGTDTVAADVVSGERRRLAAVRAWLHSHRSLYEVRALRAGRVELLDVLGGGWFAVAEPRAFAGVSVGDVAELRLVGFEGDVRFGRTFVFHPTGTRDAILANATRIRAQGGTRFDVMDLCASLRIRCVRYRHVTPRRVYESPPSGELRAIPRATLPSEVSDRSAIGSPDRGDEESSS